MSKKPANFRSGDRSETLGAAILQLIATVTLYPRPEDFGIDAIATLLRREGRLVYAEDSFLVQFKSRTTDLLTFDSDSLTVLLGHELPVFVGKCDLSASELSLFYLGDAISSVHSSYHGSSIKRMVVHLSEADGKNNFNPEDGIYKIHVGPPVLQWNASQLTCRDTEAQLFETMKRWIHVDRENRELRKLGASRLVRYKTNEMPQLGGVASTPNLDGIQRQFKPLLPLLQYICNEDPKKSEAFVNVCDSLNKCGIEVPESTMRFAKGRFLEHLLASDSVATDAYAIFGAEGPSLEGMYRITIMHKSRDNNVIHYPTIEGTKSELTKEGINFLEGTEVELSPMWFELKHLSIRSKDGEAFLCASTKPI